MKKLLAILGATTMVVSSSVTVVACTNGTKTENKNDDGGSKVTVPYLNSRNNLEGAASIIAKELILTDQFQLSRSDFERKINGRLANEEIKNLNRPILENEQTKKWSDSTSVNSLLTTYFSSSSLNMDVVDKNISLTGNRGATDGQLWAFLKNKFGLDLGEKTELIDMVLKMLPGIKSADIKNLATTYLPKLNDLVAKFVDGKKTVAEGISLAAKLILGDQDSAIMKMINERLNSINMNSWIDADTKGESLLPAGLISLGNGISTIIKKQQTSPYYRLTKASINDVKDLTKKSGSAGGNLGNAIRDLTIKGKDSAVLANDLEKNINIYVNGISDILLGLQFIQAHLFLFNDAWNYQDHLNTPDLNHLFSKDVDNKNYVKNVLNQNVLDNQKFKQLSTNDTSTLNLKYLLTILTKTFVPLDTQKDAQGHQLAKLMSILFLSPNDFPVSKGKEVDGFYGGQFLESFLMPIIANAISKKLDLDATKAAGVSIAIQKALKGSIISFNELLLTDKSVYDSAKLIIQNTCDTLDEYKSLILPNIGGLPEDKQKLIKALLDNTSSIKVGVPLLLRNIPFIGSAHSFNSLYLEEPLQLEDFINKIFGLLEGKGDLIPKDKVEPIKAKVIDINKKINGLLKDREFNIKNLLITQIKMIGDQSEMPLLFGEHYRQRSIVNIFADIANQNNIDWENGTYDASYNFEMSSLKGLWDKIVTLDKPTLIEGGRRTTKINMVSAILENPSKTSAILGLEENGTVRETSLLNFVFTNVLGIKDDGNPDSTDNLNFLFNVTSNLYKTLNHPTVGATFDNFFSKVFDEKSFDFQFQDLKLASDGVGILSETAIISYQNPYDNTEWIYTLKFARSRVEKPFHVSGFSKQAVEKEVPENPSRT
ncbi:MOLPALP family lipoprotein [Entomoplasma freundtii]|uniref:MOLPALP family lipoprotein n=1 Tax=Entomoplasma freundtii TaxID=74700 RepID=A0A2K8NR79_9MOLU|nr:MOLPALP family lipoprotein [Entomoplasma freundtii]ATZ16350.1 MOLPALP family lipoprotein [Entomoplasma freundtii]TDY56611.1 MOLPALP family lipoprotein [Entomoplasma freundtii]